MKKIFIVGCPRSGTTLLQSLLASHPDIVSFPETHLFSRTIHISPFVRFFTVYGSKHLRELNKIMEELGLPSDESLMNHQMIYRTRKWAEMLLQKLDEIGQYYAENHEEYLLEKTPRHLHYVDFIHNADPEACFIHLIRNGEDVVASLSEATGNHPEKWSGNRSIDKSVFWWNRSIKLSRRYIGKPKNVHVRYENLLEDPSGVLQYICKFIGIEYHENMVHDYHHTASSLINKEESWKSKNTKRVLNTSKKFKNLPEKQQEKVLRGLVDFDYEQIDISNY
ncbi:MAG TPA: sulfotransferase [Gracilimonas sp.]|uniref:sulfotransferase family protein n=1 Tax=Gracilimonas sp. TaxID=1974203 RepID=UPI002DB23CB6|nr:sulfotransferase [Gracilimonas sp.]